MAKYINLTKGKVAIVDDEDYGWLIEHKWSFGRNSRTDKGYAKRSKHVRIEKGKYRSLSIYMHREILKTPLEVDHINGDCLDNRKQNLRPANRTIQNRNRASPKGASSKYPGVYYNKANNCWRSQIRFEGKRVEIGSFETEEQAKDAREYFIVLNQLEGFRR